MKLESIQKTRSRGRKAGDAGGSRSFPVPARTSLQSVAMLRGFAQGMSMQSLIDTYMGAGVHQDAPTPKSAKTALRATRDSMAMVARQAGLEAEAGLIAGIRFSPKETHEPARTEVTYEEWLAGLQDAEAFSEKELLAQYEATHPSDEGPQPAPRRMEDVIAAINRVSVITVGEPKPEHALAGWLGKGVAHRMESAGVRTIGELHAFILLRGFSWWKGVKGLGRVSAGHVTAWLQQNLSTLRLDWDPMVGVAPRSPEALVLAREVVKPDAGLVPMERYAVPMDPRLTGVSGANRARGPKAIRADNDIDAMGAWLEARAAGNPHTLRAYRKEAERLLHWCHKTRGMAVSDMMVEDASEYLRFLSEIGVSPRHHEWVGRAPSRLHAGWRPFRGRLSDRSIAAAQRILTSMFHFLWQTGYVASNPFAAGRRFKGTHRATTSLSHKALPDALAACIETLFDERTREEGDAGKRWRSVRAIYLLGMDCGLRRDEIASVRRDQLEFLPRKNVWRLTFTGKGDKERSVYPTRRLIDALRAHAEDRGMDFDAPGTGDRQRWCLVAPHNRIPDADTPLDQQGYHPGSITQIVKRLADSIEAWVRGNRSELPGQATQFRTHALRHTFGTRLVEKLPVNDVRIMMGHDSLDNTSMYLNTEEDALIDRVSGLL